jgi:hypothetical protein
MKLMTDREWDTCSDSAEMLLALPKAGFARKYRLYSCACARRVWHLLQDDAPRKAIESAEAFADNLQDRKALIKARSRARRLADRLEREAQWTRAYAAHAAHHAAGTVVGGENWPAEASNCALWSSKCAVYAAASEAKCGDQSLEDNQRYARAEAAERLAQAQLLRDIFGNPFRSPPPMHPFLSTPSILLLAQSIYDNNRFEMLPALTELLVVSGCDNNELLLHFRGSGPHVRGCWALDSVLGKTPLQ